MPQHTHTEGLAGFHSCSAILVAAGSSRRMGFDKLTVHIGGKSVFAHSFAALMKCELITEIIVVGPAKIFNLVDKATFTKPVISVEGGTERHFSVASGLDALSDSVQYVAIHDAARPFLSQHDLKAVITGAMMYSAATLAKKITATLKVSDPDYFIVNSISRDSLWAIETPQVFRLDIIRSAYRYIIENHIPVTDETSAVQAIGGKTKLIESTTPNLKITSPSDLEHTNLIH